MKKQIISMALCASMFASSAAGFVPSVLAADAKVPQYQTTARIMEDLDRGLIAVKTNQSNANGTVNGIYLSWRLLGTESLENQAFDIYRDDVKIHTTGAHDATNYTDTSGTVKNKYKVVKEGESAENEKTTTPTSTFSTAQESLVNDKTSEKNAFTYVDIPIKMPDDVQRMGDGKTSTYTRIRKDGANIGGANDASVGDLDGDGDYEIVLKWDPRDSKDSAGADFTGNVYIDAYQIDPTITDYMWRIDLGKNITAGAHYTQFMVYDFDGDGKSEVAMRTAPGSIDGTGEYVSKVGDTPEIRNIDNTASYIGMSGSSKGKNTDPAYLTIFDGETGAALATTDFIPLGKSSDWGDSKHNRSERYLSAVAYLDGVHPSIIMGRGYYSKAVVRAYSWDGTELSLQWEHSGTKKAADSLYGQGNHNLSVADVDNDGFDEIVYGSAILDHDGTVKGNTFLGHGDAMHVNDFNNDGVQEVFSVKENKEGYANNAADFRVAGTGVNIWGKSGKGDTGRGVMDNVDDAYALKNPNALALGWSSSHTNVFDLQGNELKARPTAGSREFNNFLVYWDGDLGRELLDDNIIGKYNAETGGSKRFYDGSSGYSLSGSSNNHSKRTPSLTADIWGDWREEIIMPVNDGEGSTTPALRIFTSVLPTTYRLTTLMHDSQYRCSVAWQNVAYNQPTHTSYYVGSAALATDSSGNALNYLAPETPFTKVVYEVDNVAVTGVDLSEENIDIEKGTKKTINAIITPSDATKKIVTWTSSDENVATIKNGTITGVANGTATITATTRDGEFTASCEVTVYTNYVTGITLSDNEIDMGAGYTEKIKVSVSPEEATDKSYTWTSSDESIVTVSGDVITGVSEGTATITATTNDGQFSASCIVNVFPMVITDVTGENEFTSSNTDAQTTFSSDAVSASLSQVNATVGGEFHKDFESFDTNKAVISFKFTTGGQKNSSSAWNWDGREYTFGLKFLDTEGNNMLTVSQAYTSKAQSTMSQVRDETAVAVSKWSRTISEGENPVDRSATRWFVNLEFDYDEDTCTATITGATSAWESGIQYEKKFNLNGASFKTLQFNTTVDGSGPIHVTPSIAELNYKTVVANVLKTRVNIKSIEDNTVTAKISTKRAYENICVIGALYDNDGILKEIKYVDFSSDGAEVVNKDFVFDNTVGEHNLKLFMWDTIDNAVPLCAAVSEE